MDSSWIASQKKAFARWANNVLHQRGLVINDIDHDLRSGNLLISLIETLEGEKLSPRRSMALQNSSTNVHAESKIQNFTNVTKALKFIEAQGINLVNCRADHIVDNNSKMVLGLLWRVITHYHIQPLFASYYEEVAASDSLDTKSVDGSKSLRLKTVLNKHLRDALLRWCKTELEPYDITPINFTKSFQSPLVVASLVHKLKSDAINTEELDKMEPTAAFAKIFEIAEKQLGIPQILDPADLLDGGADECSVMTYIAYFVKKANPTTPIPRRPISRSNTQTELPTLSQRNIHETRVIDEASEELANENNKLRSENRLLKEFIKSELEKLGSAMEQNMQRTTQQMEAKTSFFASRTNSFKSSLERLTTKYTELVRETDKLKAEKHSLHQANIELYQENQSLQHQLSQKSISAPCSPKSMPASPISTPASPQSMPSSPKVEEVTAIPLHLDDEDEVSSTEEQAAPASPAKSEESPASPHSPVTSTSTPTPTTEVVKSASVKNVSPTIPRSASTKAQEPISISMETPGSPNTPSKPVSTRKQGLTGEALRVYHITVVQSLVRRWLTKKWVKRANRRRTVVSELINTERTHVGCLQTLLAEYFQPLRKMASEGQPLSHTLNENLLKTIFNNAEVICNINSNLLAKLEKRWESWNYDSKLGDVFLSTMEFLKCYNQYVNHYNRSLNTLAECAKMPAFMDFLKVKALKCGHQLRDLLIVPVQRIPRYVILLEEMVKYTDAKHPDYKELSLALSKMHAIADYVNEKKRDFEALAQVSAIQENLSGISILEYPRLRFLQEGDLVCEEKKQAKQHHVFLFNEIILLTKQVKKVFGDRKQKQVKYKFLELIKLTVDTKVSKHEGSFSIEIPNTIPRRFNTTTEKERDQWVQNIQTSVDKMVEAKRTKSVDRV